MRVVRLSAWLVAAGLALAASSCGSADSATTRTLRPVLLSVTAPVDAVTTQGATLTVRGSVDPPDATVRVLGQPAEVVAGSFSAQVSLDPGTNVIDLAATAPRRGPALTAVRVTREMPVTVPDLSGLTPDDARAKLAALGLKFDEQDAGGLLEQLIPGTPGVCDQEPAAGTEVRRGTLVHVMVAKRC
jgi:Glucodextranase, domain B/PASTA domain